MRKRSGLDILLIVLDLFVAISAIPFGVMLAVRPDGTLIGMPLSLLNGSCFHDYLIPGLILAIVVGGSGAWGGVMLLRRAPRMHLIAAASGAILCGWIIGEVLLLRFYHPLQAIYGGTGLIILVLGLMRNAAARAGEEGR